VYSIDVIENQRLRCQCADKGVQTRGDVLASMLGFGEQFDVHSQGAQGESLGELAHARALAGSRWSGEEQAARVIGNEKNSY